MGAMGADGGQWGPMWANGSQREPMGANGGQRGPMAANGGQRGPMGANGDTAANGGQWEIYSRGAGAILVMVLLTPCASPSLNAAGPQFCENNLDRFLRLGG